MSNSVAPSVKFYCDRCKPRKEFATAMALVAHGQKAHGQRNRGKK